MFGTCRTMDQLEALMNRMSMLEAEVATLRSTPPPSPIPPPVAPPGPPPGLVPAPAPAPAPPPSHTTHWFPHPKSDYRGVSWDKPSRSWRVQLGKTKRGPKNHIGLFHNEEEGARAWDVIARQRDYPAHKLNFPDE